MYIRGAWALAVTGVEDNQAATTNSIHGVFEVHEGNLVIMQKTIEAVLQLDDSEYGADKNVIC